MAASHRLHTHLDRTRAVIRALTGRNPEMWALVGFRRHCLNCGRRFGSFLPYREGSAVLSGFLKHAGYVTGDFDSHACPACRIGDRERHLFLYFDALDIWGAASGASILHFAPEPYLGPRLRSIAERYVAADLHPANDDVVAMDLMHIDSDDHEFDVLVCNHVLEHVPDPTVALAEAHRVLRPGGLAVLQTPYASRLQKTFEDPLITSDEDRLYFYGQEDHSRLFGRDLFDMIRDAGFELRHVGHSEVLANVNAAREGVSTDEGLILAIRA